MKKLLMTFSAVALLTVPAMAGSAIAIDKPFVVAQDISVSVGGGDRDRDMRRHPRRAPVIVVKRHRRDWDRGDRGHERHGRNQERRKDHD